MAKCPRGDGKEDYATDGDQLERNVVWQADQQRSEDGPDDAENECTLRFAERVRNAGEDEKATHNGQRQHWAQADIEDDDREGWQHEVEMERREAGVPVRGPTGQSEVGQQFVAKERGAPNMGSHVAARWC